MPSSTSAAGAVTAAVGGSGTPSPDWLVAAAWLAVGIPIAWGVWMTLQKAAILFGSEVVRSGPCRPGGRHGPIAGSLTEPVRGQ